MAGNSPRLMIRILGAAAGGGFPQWNCACLLCGLARTGDPRTPARTQAGLAISADGSNWVLIGASPDLRQQILASPELTPRSPRHSPIGAVALLNADVDGIVGLLALREGHQFRILAPLPILAILRRNVLFDVLDPALVRRESVSAGERLRAAPGLFLTFLPVAGKTPLYLENRQAEFAEPGENYALRIEAHGRRAVAAPSCAALTHSLREECALADLILFDGTVFTDEEMIAAGVGTKTGRRMGHVPLCAAGGPLAQLGPLPGRKILYHINNTNPILLADSPERRQVEEAGFEVAEDGRMIAL